MDAIKNIDDFFKPTSLVVAEAIMGMSVECKRDGNVYVVSGTKAYRGNSKQTQSKPRLLHGGIMMFNIRGHPHFCVAAGTQADHDYFLIHNLIRADGEEIKSASGVSEALRLGFGDDGRRFADYFNLGGTTQPSIFMRQESDASTCLGVYQLRK